MFFKVVCWKKQGMEERGERRGTGKTWKEREKAVIASEKSRINKQIEIYVAINIDKVADCCWDILDHLEKQLNTQPCLYADCCSFIKL